MQILANSSSVVDIIYFENISVHIPSVKTLTIIVPNTISSITATIKNKLCNFYILSNTPQTLDLVSVQTTLVISDQYTQTINTYSVIGNFRIFTFCLGVELQESLQIFDELEITTATETRNIIIDITSQEIDERALVLLQNLKKPIEEDYLLATKSYIQNKGTVDSEFLNRKNLEFIRNVFSLTDELGSYKHLKAILTFLEWQDDVEIKEYWKDLVNNKYIMSNTVSEFADIFDFNPNLLKTGFLGLYYEINHHNGDYDSDGIPIYVKVLSEFRTLYTKILILKNLLNKNHLSDDSKIIDIVGIFTSFLGIDGNIIINNVEFLFDKNNIDLTYMGMNLKYKHEDKLYISEHKALLKNSFYENADIPTDETLELIDDSIYQEPKPIFEILKYDEQISIDESINFHLLKRFYRGDFVVAHLEFKSYTLPSQVKMYFISIDEFYSDSLGWSRKIESDTYPISHFIPENIPVFGVRTTGLYRINIHFIDGYGGVSIASTKLDVNLKENFIDLEFFRAKYINETSQLGYVTRTLETIDTYEVLNDNFESVESSFPVEIAKNGAATSEVYKYYADSTRLLNTAIPVLTNTNMNLVPVTKLTKVPLINYGCFYETFLFDFIADGTNGERTIRMKKFNGHSWDIISFSFDNSISELIQLYQYINKIHEFIEQNPDSLFANYDYKVVKMSTDDTVNNSKFKLLALSKISEFSLKIYKYEFSANDEVVNDEVEFNKIDPLGDIPAMVFVELNDDIILSETKVWLDNEEFIVNSTTIDDLETDLLTELEGKDCYIKKVSSTRFIISSKKYNNIKIQFGDSYVLKDTYRNSYYSKLYRCPTGNEYHQGMVIFVAINQEEKFEMANIKWKIKNTLNNKLIHTDYNKYLRFAFMSTGIFTVECEVYDKVNKKILQIEKKGAIKII